MDRRRLLRSRIPASAVLALLALGGLAGTPALAKDGQEVQLDTPISLQTPPGTTLDVGWSVFVEDTTGRHPFTSPGVFIRLVPPAGATPVEAAGLERPRGSGKYRATITVPAGGIAQVEVGIIGEACDATGCTRSDILFPLADDALVSGAPADAATFPMRVHLDRPLPTDLAPGSRVDLAFTMQADVGPYNADPLSIRITDRHGTVQLLDAVRDRDGHYLVTMTVPEEGLARIDAFLPSGGPAPLTWELFSAPPLIRTVGPAASPATTGTTPARGSVGTAPLPVVLGVVLLAALAALTVAIAVRRSPRTTHPLGH